MKTDKSRLVAIAYFTLAFYVFGLTCLWCVLDLFHEDAHRKLYQDRYDLFYSGGVVGVAVLFLASGYIVDKCHRKWPAILGFATCLFWVAWACLPRL